METNHVYRTTISYSFSDEKFSLRTKQVRVVGDQPWVPRCISKGDKISFYIEHHLEHSDKAKQKLIDTLGTLILFQMQRAKDYQIALYKFNQKFDISEADD